MPVTDMIRAAIQPECAADFNEAAETATWYKDAVIYQVHVKSFFDSSGDGVGDFRGLTQKLDYIQELGVSAIWLLPFYPSPLRDDGYDISDYTRVNPLYGGMRDFKRFLAEAHRRDLRVITELVLNHTSDQHPWFQRARKSPPGGKWRDFYVWSDAPDKYAEARIIFKDFEQSNWTFDPVANAYYWHRFYSHQPDLNFDNPAVRQAMLETLEFWLELGVDGVRLDAVPYLYEREGTTCENLPETHAFLREIRRFVEEKFEGKMLLAEANQWPEDAAAYFGDGDECHMNFHFPLMPRLYMALQQEDRFPVMDILQQTPEIPPNCQWAIFLRNHDELTLEMVTDEERDYMYRAYAGEAKARINLGIRRRLAPLMRDNRRKIELMNALLLSLPGTPIIYYGDEIGMGDNIYLGDRDGIRTPMQWTADRNAGFSSANPQQLFLPVIIDPLYHYATRNVESEASSPHSLLWWMRKMIGLRRKYSAFGRGTFQFLVADNPKVLSYVRKCGDDIILVVANLSRFVQSGTLDLSPYRGMTPVELIGQTRLPVVADSPYTLTLGPYTFYWLKLEAAAARSEAISLEDLPAIHITGDWESLFSGKARLRLQFHLPRYLRQHRWFGGKARTIQTVEIEEAIPLPGAAGGERSRALLVRVEYSAGDPERYLLPVCAAGESEAGRILEDHPAQAIAWVKPRGEGERQLIYEAIHEESFWISLMQTVARRRTIKGERADLTPLQTRSFRKLHSPDAANELSLHGGEQSNTSAIFGKRMICKLFRRVNPGVNPDLEIGRYLTEKAALPHVPDVAGALEYRSNGEPMTLAVFHEFQPNEGDAWKFTLDALGRYVEEVLTSRRGESPPLPGPSSLLQLAGAAPPELAHQAFGNYLTSAALLGRRTAELHLALAAKSDDPAFAPEPFTPFYQRGLYESLRTQSKRLFQLLRQKLPTLPEETAHLAEDVFAAEPLILEQFRRLREHSLSGLRIRCHGDYHLGQVLYTGRDFVIIDFEGEPERPLSERRIKTSPLRDVAGMIRSFHYAAHATLRGQASGVDVSDDDLRHAEPWMQFWYLWTIGSFLKAYRNTAAEGDFLPQTNGEFEILLNAYVLQKLLYELRYELNNRPSWAPIPLSGIQEIVEAAG